MTVLLTLELCLIFLAAPLAAEGLPIARPIIETMVMAMVLVVGMLSHRRGAIIVILLGVAAMLASVSPGSGWAFAPADALHRGGSILTFSALSCVLSRAVYAPGRITSHHLQGAVVLNLNLAIIFASLFSLIRELNPAAFATPASAASDLGELATMLYFSLTTLTTTGIATLCRSIRSPAAWQISSR